MNVVQIYTQVQKFRVSKFFLEKLLLFFSIKL